MSKLNYILGWLACDGSFESNGCTIALQLQQRDEEVIDLFCKVLGAKKDPNYRTLNGRNYVRGRLHSGKTWDKLVTFFNSRLKEEKHFPNNADHFFVVGCLDADGTFYNHRGYIEGEFGHSSGFFLDGLQRWLKSSYDIDSTLRSDRSILRFSEKACKRIEMLYWEVPFALERKRDVLLYIHEKETNSVR